MLAKIPHWHVKGLKVCRIQIAFMASSSYRDYSSKEQGLLQKRQEVLNDSNARVVVQRGEKMQALRSNLFSPVSSIRQTWRIDVILTTSAEIIYTLTHYEQIDKGFLLLDLIAELISPTDQARIGFAKDVLS